MSTVRHSQRLWRPLPRKTTTYHNFIDGSWVPSVSGDLFENRNPANTDDLIGVFQKSTAADVGARHRRRAPRVRALAARAGAPARGAPVSRRAAPRRSQGGAGARHDARDGQGPRRDARRRPGSDRHDLLHGRRGAPPVRPDRAVRAARQVRDVDPPAGRRLARSSRRGISRWRSRRGRSSRRSSAATPSSSSRRR